MENAEIWENEAQFNLDAGSALVKERDDQIADLTRRLELAEKALEHYADKSHWRKDFGSTEYMFNRPGYNIADEALNAIREGK